MKQIGLIIMLCLTGCACGRRGASEKQLRQALSDTNAALTECRQNEQARQLQAERLARKIYRKKHK